MQSNYSIVPEFSETTTHWLSYEKNNHVSLNKLYQLHPDNNNGCVRDDNGIYGEWHLMFKGDYVIANIDKGNK
jgi:hypothetical protein